MLAIRQHLFLALSVSEKCALLISTESRHQSADTIALHVAPRKAFFASTRSVQQVKV